MGIVENFELVGISRKKYKWEQSQYYNDGSINKILVTDYRAEEAKMFAFNLILWDKE